MTDLRALLNNATQAPWYADTMPESHYVLNYDPDDNEARFQSGNHVVCGVFVSGTNPNRDADRALIVALVNQAHTLLDITEAARELRSLAMVSFDGDPWYAGNAGMDGEAILERFDAALARLDTPQQT